MDCTFITVSLPLLEASSIGGFLFSKLKNQLPPTGLLAAGLVVVTLLTALSGLWNYNHELTGQPPAKLSVATNAQKAIPGVLGKTSAPAAAVTGLTGPTAGTAFSATSPSAASSSRPAPGKSAVPSPSSSTAPAATSTAPNQLSSGAAAPASTVSVALSVNSSAKGRVQLAAGSNQCDVLTQAQANGLISGLLMVYYSQYGSEAVYKIDGIGDPGTVGWTYTVNGVPPPYGCSLVPAHNGDSVNWQYQ